MDEKIAEVAREIGESASKSLNELSMIACLILFGGIILIVGAIVFFRNLDKKGEDDETSTR